MSDASKSARGQELSAALLPLSTNASKFGRPVGKNSARTLTACPLTCAVSTPHARLGATGRRLRQPRVFGLNLPWHRQLPLNPSRVERAHPPFTREIPRSFSGVAEAAAPADMSPADSLAQPRRNGGIFGCYGDVRPRSLRSGNEVMGSSNLSQRAGVVVFGVRGSR